MIHKPLHKIKSRPDIIPLIDVLFQILMLFVAIALTSL